MFFLFSWLLRWAFSGLSFLAVAGYVAFWYTKNYLTVPIGDVDPDKEVKADLQDEEEMRNLREKSLAAESTDKPLSGWLTIRRQFKPSYSGMAPCFAGTTAPTANEGATDNEPSGEGKDPVQITDDSASVASGATATSTYSSRIAQTYRSMVEARAAGAPKDYYYCVLKGPVLFVYEDENANNCLAALDISNHLVRVERDDGQAFDGKDGEMFAKRNAIVLRTASQEGKHGLSVVAKGMQAETENKEVEKRPFFLFTKSNTIMEDWYIGLLTVSSQSPTTDHIYDQHNMRVLVDTIDTEPDPIPMRWFNAMLGRVFFALYKTDALEQFIIGKIMKKLKKVNRPSFLGPIVVSEVNVGTTAPIFSKPMLKNLTVEGDAAFEVHMQYRAPASLPESHVKITIGTTATIPTGFKPLVMDLVLAVVLKSLEGNLLVQIKRPPSNRVWYGFTKPPKMDIEIRPVVGDRKIQLNMVLKAIEKQLRDVIAESVVLPNMDDIAFFDTAKLDVRGGLFDEASKTQRTSKATKEEQDDSTAETVAIATSNEDPSSAVPATSSVRHRVTKSRTEDIDGVNPLKVSSETSLPRVDSTPTPSAASVPVRSATAVQATKRWFAQTGASRPSSLLAQTVGTGAAMPTVDTSTTRRSQSVERPMVVTDEPQPFDSSENLPGSATSAPLPKSVLLANDSTKLSRDPSSDSVSHAKGEIDVHRLVANPQPKQTTPSILSTATEDTLPSSPASQYSSTASLINSIRSRDKKAIQAQAATARESLKKWGVGFAAKRRGVTVNEAEETRPAALYRPPDEDVRQDERSAVPTSPTLSLQDRLSAAAHTGTAPLPIPNRERSASNSSRPSLFTSPGKSAASPASSSPPKWAHPNTKPTTAMAKEEQATAHHLTSSAAPSANTSSARRPSHSAPVYAQPTQGKSMVVPRVPKRPGQVTGMGRGADDELIRQVSMEGTKQNEVDTGQVNTTSEAPPLPARRSQDVTRPGVSESHRTAENVDEVILPPLPPRAVSTAQGPHLTSNQPSDSSSSTASEPSAPVTIVANDAGSADPPAQTMGAPADPAVPESSPASDEADPPATIAASSDAEQALRQLVARDGATGRGRPRKSAESVEGKPDEGLHVTQDDKPVGRGSTGETSASAADD
ncbi:hypothetical protein IAU60_003317 [Kwoniella sp. DSM 27419]